METSYRDEVSVSLINYQCDDCVNIHVKKSPDEDIVFFSSPICYRHECPVCKKVFFLERIYPHELHVMTIDELPPYGHGKTK